MGCQHYDTKGGAEWCNHYDQPIRQLKSQPVKLGEELVVEVSDIHESGAGVGRTEDGFIVLVDGVLPDARSKVRVTKVRDNHARAEEIERLELDDDGEDEPEGEAVTSDDDEDDVRLGSREDFWGG
jgi:predicted RNA-binding protein with TRAM domain